MLNDYIHQINYQSSLVDEIKSYVTHVLENNIQASIYDINQKLDLLHEEMQGEENQTLLQFKIVTTTLIDYCKNHGCALSFAASFNLVDYLPLLIANGADLNTIINKECGLLETCIDFRAFESVKYLIDQHPETLKINTRKIIQAASLSNNTKMRDYIYQKIQEAGLSDSIENITIDESAIHAAKRLYFVLGGAKLSQLIETKNTYFDGIGGRDEGVSTLANYLFLFSSLVDDPGQAKISSMIKLLSHTYFFDFDEDAFTVTAFMPFLKFREDMHHKRVEDAVCQIDKLAINESVLLASGFLLHFSACSIKKLGPNRYMLSIADRGPLLRERKSVSYKNNRYRGLQSLIFSADKLNNIIDALSLSQYLSKEYAVNLLFKEIPKIANSRFTTHPHVIQPIYKTPICYYANAKTLLYGEFIDHFGLDQGKSLYKSFSLFSRNQVVKECEAHFGSDNPFVQAGKKIVEDKNAKYADHFASITRLL